MIGMLSGVFVGMILASGICIQFVDNVKFQHRIEMIEKGTKEFQKGFEVGSEYGKTLAGK